MQDNKNIIHTEKLSFTYFDNNADVIEAEKIPALKELDVSVKQGEGFSQGIFIEYGITYDDEVSEVRDGGFGSTTKK